MQDEDEDEYEKEESIALALVLRIQHDQQNFDLELGWMLRVQKA